MCEQYYSNMLIVVCNNWLAKYHRSLYSSYIIHRNIIFLKENVLICLQCTANFGQVSVSQKINCDITVPVDGLAPNGARPSAGTGMTVKFNRFSWKLLWLSIILYNIPWPEYIIQNGRRDLTKSHSALTHWDLVMPYVTTELGQHWPRQWLVAWWYQAITWTNVDLTSIEFCGIHMTTLSQKGIKISIHEIHLKITLLKLLPNLAGANDLNVNIYNHTWYMLQQ